ncbi:MAG: GNAT family N-acetyltransferase [Steroidobacteraceae bacterium]
MNDRADAFTLRVAQSADDTPMAAIIRTVMPAFGACGAGFAINDPEVDGMSAAYRRPRAAYYVVEAGGRVVGGGGIAPLDGGPFGTCELRKMYFLPEARGLGVGARLLARCLATARGYGYRACYLETLTGMDAAQRLYHRAGFRKIPAALGATGHHGCDRYFLLEFP